MNESKATRYQRFQRRARIAGVASGGVMLALVALTPLSSVVARWAEGAGRGLPAWPHAVAALLLYVIVLVVVWELALLPAALYLGLAVDSRYGRGRPSVDDVLASQAQATLVALPAAIVAGGVIQLSVVAAGSGWWLVAGLSLAVCLVAALHGAPVLVARLAGARPLAGTPLAARLGDLAGRARVPIGGVDELRVRDARTTALVAGAGRSRRIFLSADLLRDWSDDEIAVVVAHELAHHAHHDLWRTLALDASLLSLGLLVADRVVAGRQWSSGALTDLSALPIVALVAGAVWLAATPLRHALSRRQERKADEFALALTGGADAFSAAIRRLGAQHLAEERPSAMTQWLYHRHPTVAERLATANTFAAGARTLNPER
jgi:STE24 endopeptidase